MSITSIDKQAEKIWVRMKQQNMDVEMGIKRYFDAILYHALAHGKLTSNEKSYSYGLKQLNGYYNQQMLFLFEGEIKRGYQIDEWERRLGKGFEEGIDYTFEIRR